MKTFAEILEDQDRRLAEALEELQKRGPVPEAIANELYEQLEALNTHPEPTIIHNGVRA